MKSILLIGLGRFGKHIAMELKRLGHDVLGIDCDETHINEVMPYLTSGQIGDSTNRAFLASLGVQNFDLCIVSIAEDFESSLETTDLLKELGAKFIVARAEQDTQEKFLLKNGADAVVYPEKQLGKWTAVRFSSEHILDYIELDNKHSIFEVGVPEKWIDKTVGEIDIRKKYGVNILAIRENEQLNFSVNPQNRFSGADTILVSGEYENLKKCFHV